MDQAICLNCKKEFNYYVSASKGKYCSYKCYWFSKKGVYPQATGQEIKPFFCIDCGSKFDHRVRSTKRCIDCNNKASKIWLKVPHLQARGENHHNWKGGITPIKKLIRESFEYNEWRIKVFERDSYTCRECKQIGGYLQADHIKPFALFPELRFEISNGQTLCFDCHKIKTSEDRKKYKFTDGRVTYATQ